MSVNKVLILGNLGNAPEVRYLEGNRGKVASFRVATTERYKDRNGETKELTEWHTVNAWDKRADFVEKYLKKGAQVYIEGRLKTRSYQDKDGNERYATEITADNIQLLGKRPDDSAQPTAQTAHAQQSAPAPVVTAEDAGDDDLPF